MESEDGRLRINVVSQPLFLEAIKTLPVSPEFAEIRLKAVKGLFQGRIVPNWKIKLKYEYNMGFVPSSYDGLHLTDASPKSSIDLIAGGRISDIELEMRIGVAQEGFKQFRDSLLPALIHNKYDLFWGDLVISTYHLTGYNQGDYRSGGLRFDAGWIHKGLELDLDSEMPEEQRNKLKDWFSQLSKKYK